MAKTRRQSRKHRKTTRKHRRTYGGAWYDPRSWFAPKAEQPQLVRQNASRNLLAATRRNNIYNNYRNSNNMNNNFNPYSYQTNSLGSYGLGRARR